MALNFPGPYILEIEYSVDGLTHRQALNCDVDSDQPPGSALSTFDFKTRGGSTVQADTAVEAYAALMKELYTDDCTIDVAHLWYVTPESFDRTWRTSYAIGETGTDAVNTYNKAAEFMFTFRTVEGGHMRLVYEETYTGNDFSKNSVGVLTPSGAYDNVVQFVISTDNWILARDTSYPIAGLYFLRGQNEVLFRKRWR